MKAAVKILCMLLGLQMVAFLATSYIVFKSKPVFLIYLACLLPLLILADSFLWRGIKRNAEIYLMRFELEKKEEQAVLEEQYVKRQNQWKQEFSTSRELLAQKLMGIINLMNRMVLEERRFDKTKMRSLLDDIEATLIKAKEIHYCDHVLSNIILCEKVKTAAEKQIKVEVKTAVPDGIAPTDTEMCSIWCNLLDNAIEACERKGKGQLWIDIKAAVVEGYFYIKVENAADSEKVSLNTSKKDILNHGYGRTILKELAKKYDGGFEEKLEKERYIAIFTIEEKRG